MSKMFEGAASIVMIVFFLLGQFPGGTIFMAIKCSSRRLDGWDWVLSVVIPFYGLMKGLFSSAC